MSPDFQTSLQAGDLDGVRRCAKSDLHNHFVLRGERNFLAQRTGRDIAPLDRRLTSMAEMHAWVQGAVGELFHNRDGRLLGFEAAPASNRAVADYPWTSAWSYTSQVPA